MAHFEDYQPSHAKKNSPQRAAPLKKEKKLSNKLILPSPNNNFNNATVLRHLKLNVNMSKCNALTFSYLVSDEHRD
jgi:hypothetical protein